MDNGTDPTNLVSIPSLAYRIKDAIRAVMGPGTVVLSEPILMGNEWLYIKECLDTCCVASAGRFVEKFEADLVQFTGSKHAIAVVNATAGLHVSLRLVGVTSNDEVLVPAMTFVATANAVSYCGAIPHFVDIEPVTLGIDAVALRDYLYENTEQRSRQCINRRTGRRIKALVPMHTFGHPSNLDLLLSVAHDFNLELVEDAAESIGSFYGEQHTGTFGKFGVLSFNGNKSITTGGGGAILTSDAKLAGKARHLVSTAKVPHEWEYRHDEIGYNYRMPNLNAALGVAQLEQLPQILAAKGCLFEKYEREFSLISEVNLLKEPPGAKSNYWLQTLVLSPDQRHERDQILQITNKSGLMTRPAWVPLYRLNPYEASPRMDLSQTDYWYDLLINIPSSTSFDKH